MKQFLKMFAACLLALMITGGVCLLMFFVTIAALSAETPVSVPSNAVLVIDLNRPIMDRPGIQDPTSVFSEALGGEAIRPVSLRSVLEGIRNAAGDERISAILLRNAVRQQGYYSGWATLKEIREALASFKESGKPVYAYSMAWGEPGYYLASVADSISLHPLGLLEFNGLSSEQVFFANALKKYGIEVQVLRVGKFKAAVEPFLLDHMSPEAREQTSKLLFDILDDYSETIAEARSIPRDSLNTMADEMAVFKADEAVEAGLVDHTAYWDEVKRELQDLTGSEDKDDFPSIGIGHYWDAIGKQFTGRGDRIAVIFAEGNIVDGKSKTDVGGASMAELLAQARRDDKVKAVVLRVNSPGGSALASEVIQRETRLIKEAGKKFVVSMGTVAASGGYWISAYADQIVAEPTTITGSIGVFGLVPNFKGLANSFGVTFDTVNTNRYADLASVFKSKSTEELALFQKFTEQIYSEFLAKVAEGRNMDVERVHEIAQGRVWSGVEAKELGLVDKLGGLQDAIDAAAELASLKDYQLHYYQRKKDLGELLVDMLNELEDQSRVQWADESLRRVMRRIDDLRLYNDPDGVYARLEFDLKIK